MKNHTHEAGIEAYMELKKKLDKFCEARRILVHAFNTLKYDGTYDDTTPEWKNMCRAAGISETVDIGTFAIWS